MNPMEAVSSVLSKYATFKGRAARSEFWWWWLINIVITMLLARMGEPNILLTYWLATVIPNLAVIVRRHHDGNRSGWFILLGLIPIIGTLILLFLYISKGTDGPNVYGPDPLGYDPNEF